MALSCFSASVAVFGGECNELEFWDRSCVPYSGAGCLTNALSDQSVSGLRCCCLLSSSGRKRAPNTQPFRTRPATMTAAPLQPYSSTRISINGGKMIVPIPNPHREREACRQRPSFLEVKRDTDNGGKTGNAKSKTWRTYRKLYHTVPSSD